MKHITFDDKRAVVICSCGDLRCGIVTFEIWKDTDEVFLHLHTRPSIYGDNFWQTFKNKVRNAIAVFKGRSIDTCIEISFEDVSELVKWLNKTAQIASPVIQTTYKPRQRNKSNFEIHDGLKSCKQVAFLYEDDSVDYLTKNNREFLAKLVFDNHQKHG